MNCGAASRKRRVMWKHDAAIVAFGVCVAGALASCSGGDSPGITEAPDRYLASGVALSRIESLQSLAVPLVVDGAAVANLAAPIVRGVPGAIRIAATLTGDAAARTKSIAAVGFFDNPSGQRIVRVSSAHAAEDYAAPSLASTWQLPLDGSELQEGTTFRVALVDADRGEGSAEDARFPKDATLTPLASEATGSLEVVLVPIRWNVDQSGRLPDTSDAQVAVYKSLFERMYPAKHVSISVHAPVDFASSGSFSAVNDALVDLRAKENIDNRAYVHGLMNPADTFDAFCNDGCTTGLGFVVDDPADGSIRVSSGTGFTGIDSAWTMVHEVGHQHGRMHAPCGVSGADRQFPQRDGTIGLWGYDRSTPTMLNINSHDFMSYCDQNWVSQYTWAALLTRIQAVGIPALEQRSGASAASVQLVRLVHRRNGEVLFVGAPVRMRMPHAAAVESVVLEHADGTSTTAMVPRIDTGEVGVDALVVPVELTSAVKVRGARFVLPASRP